jgi:hypothetical protein
MAPPWMAAVISAEASAESSSLMRTFCWRDAGMDEEPGLRQESDEAPGLRQGAEPEAAPEGKASDAACRMASTPAATAAAMAAAGSTVGAVWLAWADGPWSYHWENLPGGAPVAPCAEADEKPDAVEEAVG